MAKAIVTYCDVCLDDETELRPVESDQEPVQAGSGLRNRQSRLPHQPQKPALQLGVGEAEDLCPEQRSQSADPTPGRVVVASPVYHRADLLPAVSGLSFTDRLLVRVVPATEEAAVGELIQALGAETLLVIPNEQYGAIYQVRVDQDQDLFQLVRAFEQSPDVSYAGVDWRQL